MGNMVLTMGVWQRFGKIVKISFLFFIAAVAGLFLAMRRFNRFAKEPGEPKSSSNFLAERIKNYIAANYGRQELSLDIMAAEMGLSGSYVSKKLKAATGQGFSEYLAEFRIEEAKKALISHQEKNLTQIALECGFNSPAYFNKTFKKLNNGQNPSEFRKQM
jgi:YesN/AraC family two-component response regulator